MNMNNITLSEGNLDSFAQMLAQKVSNFSRPQLKGDTITLDEYAETWFEAKKHDIEQTTLSKYFILYRKHLKPVFGSMVLTAIKREQVQAFINALAERQYKLSTIQEIRNVLSPMLKLAVADDYIYKNPCDAVKLPKVAKKKKRPATHDEFLKLLEVSKGHRLWIAIPLFFLSGCRRGELLALTWEDIDFQNRCIHITKQYTVDTGSGKAILKDNTKTPAGVRDIPIVPPLYNALKRYRDNEGKGKKYVLSQLRKDEMIHPSTFYRLFKNWLYSADVSDDITPHSTRHYVGATLIKAGVSPEIVRQFLGHKDLSTTLDVYGYDNKLDSKDTKEIFKAMGDLSPTY